MDHMELIYGSQLCTSKFIVPDWGAKVDSGRGLSDRAARVHRLAGRFDNPMPKSTISPSQRLRIWRLVYFYIRFK
jgi:hypothetical protein